MSTLNIRTLLSKSVTAIKNKLGIDSFTWGEYEDKLAEAMAGGGSDVDLVTFFEDGSNADAVAAAAKQVTKIRNYAFYRCYELTTVVFPLATQIGDDAFYYCSTLTTIDLHVATKIGHEAFSYSNKVATLILRNTAAICTITSTRSLLSTKIASGTGYIYVPSALIDSYKTATNWSTYANQFRALEDYTVDGTTTGELDSSKI